MRPERVWYVAYGSNVNEARFMRYLLGDSDHVGARDPSPPERSAWTTAPLALRFAGKSQRWGGGVCFVDPDPASVAYVRAWDITAEQFEDVFAQENRREVGSTFDWQSITAGPSVIGTSWYAQVVPLAVPALPAADLALTFTWTTPLPLNPPSPAYRDTIVAGLTDHPGLSPTDIDNYLITSVRSTHQNHQKTHDRTTETCQARLH